MVLWVGLAVTEIVRNLLDVYLMQRFIIRWRVWLTRRLTRDWLHRGALHRRRVVSPATGSTATPTTADASSNTRSTTPISASSRTSTPSPPAPARGPTHRVSEHPKRWCSAR